MTIAEESITCNWRWFIHLATAISTNRNGSKLGIFARHIAELVGEGCEISVESDGIRFDHPTTLN